MIRLASVTQPVTQSTKFVPLKGSPPIPTHVDCPRPTALVWKTCMKDNQKANHYQADDFRKWLREYKWKKKRQRDKESVTASYVNVPDRETIPIFPGLWMYPGMIPILHSPGLIIPGQLGPISLVLVWLLRAAFTRTYITKKNQIESVKPTNLSNNHQ